MILADMFSEYQKRRNSAPRYGEVMPYRWENLPNPISCVWLAYGFMFDEYSMEIANLINSLTDYLNRLMVWESILEGVAEENLFGIKYEFIDPIATVALNSPYVIKNRLVFAATHLLFQVNSIVGVARPLRPDRKIEIADADKQGADWTKYPIFRDVIKSINSDNFTEKMGNFRNLYTHRFPPGLVLGQTLAIERTKSTQNEGISWAVSLREPLSICVINQEIKGQCIQIYRAFTAFQDLVRELEGRITDYENVKS